MAINKLNTTTSKIKHFKSSSAMEESSGSSRCKSTDYKILL